jgi:DNA-binding XRE family transcriptional regulator
MPEPQFIHTEQGGELVVLTRADYDELLSRAEAADEDADDVAIYDARKAALVAGADTLLPAEVGAAMLKGDSLLKALRRWRGLSQVDVAERSGLGQGYLSDLESGRRSGSLETLEKLAAALEVPSLWLTNGGIRG